MPTLSSFTHLAPWHVITYGTLLGTDMFQSFVGGVVAYKVLPRSAFATLQTGIFPIYFSIQTALPIVLALTFPGVRTAMARSESGFKGVMELANRPDVLIPLATMFLTGLSNLVYFGPATTTAMRERKHQETRDGKKAYDPVPHSAEMQRLNKKFALLHSFSSVVNLVGLVAMMWYGATLTEIL